MCCSLLTETLKESRSGKLATASGRAFHFTMASEKRVFIVSCTGLDLVMSVSGSTGILCELVGHSLKEVLPQVHKQFCKRDIDVRLCSRVLQLSWLSMSETLDLVS